MSGDLNTITSQLVALTRRLNTITSQWWCQLVLSVICYLLFVICYFLSWLRGTWSESPRKRQETWVWSRVHGLRVERLRPRLLCRYVPCLFPSLWLPTPVVTSLDSWLPALLPIIPPPCLGTSLTIFCNGNEEGTDLGSATCVDGVGWFGSTDWDDLKCRIS